MMKRFLLSVLAVAFISMPAIAQETPAPEALVPAVSEPVPAVPTEAVTAPADAAAGAPATAASATVVADPNAPVDPMAAAAITTPPVDPNAPKGTGVHPNDMSSLVFTYWEHTAIKDARRARGLVRPPTEAELMKDLNAPEEDLSVKPPPEERDISLGGIVFVNGEDWTIWLNGKRVTPKALPEEAMDLQVYDEYIELKWYDKYTNQIFPIRLRAHQRFNIDTRIFLPG